MQKKFVIINNDRQLSDLIEEQVSLVFENNFNIKFLTTCNIKSLDKFETIDLIIVNYIFIKNNYNLLINLADKKKSKIIIIFDDKVDRSQLKKFNNFNFVVKPFKLSQMINIIKDFFIVYEKHKKYINITQEIFRLRLKTY